MSVFKKIFGVPQSESESIGDSSHDDSVFDLDPDLISLIDRLRLMEYTTNFMSHRILYSDLPTISNAILRQVIPHDVPRGRLHAFIQAHLVEPSDAGSESTSSSHAHPVAPDPQLWFGASSGSATTRMKETYVIDPKNVLYSPRPSSLLKSGSYGKVIRAKYRVGIGSIDVVIKAIDIDGETTTQRLVLNEVELLAGLSHPNIVQTYGCWFATDRATGQEWAYIVFEFCGGGDLEDVWKRARESGEFLTCIQKMQVLIQVAEGLEFIHKNNIIHRDLKPQNVLVGSDLSTIKICDFGAAKRSRRIRGTLCGTPAYMAPEQGQGGRPINPHLMDIYAFGMLIWTFWTGDKPFTHNSKWRALQKNGLQLLAAIREEGERPPTDLESLEDCPDQVIELMDQCWSEDQEDRPQTFGIVSRKMKEVLAMLIAAGEQ